MSRPRDTALLATVGALIGLLILFLGILVGANGGATRSEWMSLSGSIIGSAMTVAGALLIFEWQHLRGVVRHRRMLSQQLLTIIGVAHQLQAMPTNLGRTGADSRQAALTILEDAIENLKEARSWAAPADAKMAQAYITIGRITPDTPELSQMRPSTVNVAEKLMSAMGRKRALSAAFLSP